MANLITTLRPVRLAHGRVPEVHVSVTAEYTGRMDLSRELTAIEYYSQITSKEVAQLFGITRRSTLWAWVKAGKIPKPRYLSPHQPRWRLGEVVEALEKLPGFDDAPRGLKGHVPDEEVPTTRSKKNKESNIWARLGLNRPT